MTILGLAERVKQATGSDSEIVYIPYHQVYGQGIEDTLHREPATGKIKDAIGWQTTRNLDPILADVIEHTRGRAASATASRRQPVACGVAAWLGFGEGERLEGRVAVLSPHLDDAVFSLGAAIAAAPGDVRVVTVLAGDPGRRTGRGVGRARRFPDAGRGRARPRVEDERACRDLGARPVWLPFNDHQYERGGTTTRSGRDSRTRWARRRRCSCPGSR